MWKKNYVKFLFYILISPLNFIIFFVQSLTTWAREFSARFNCKILFKLIVLEVKWIQPFLNFYITSSYHNNWLTKNRQKLQQRYQTFYLVAYLIHTFYLCHRNTKLLKNLQLKSKLTVFVSLTPKTPKIKNFIIFTK